ncbi:mannosyltransferase [Scheffersomyces coipomensis]|uniref:mannosyltransferase n=1 Tax=Scheffersomyces coipomensis TaxID=1788519 RepID=UPI00315CE6E4
MFNIKYKLKGNRLLAYVGVGVWILALNVYLYCYHLETISDGIETIIDTTNQHLQSFNKGNNDESSTSDSTYDAFDQQDQPNSGYKPLNTSILSTTPFKLYIEQYLEDKRNIDPIFSSNYETMFNINDDNLNTNPDFYKFLSTLDFNDRCQLYFENLFDHNQNWFINPNERAQAHRFNFDFDTFLNDKRRELQEHFNEDNGKNKNEQIDDQNAFNKYVDEKYHEYADSIYQQEQTMVDSLSHLRIFNKCYLTSNDISQQNTIKNFIAEQKHFGKSMLVLEKQDLKHKTTKASNNKNKKRSIKIDPTKDCSNLEERLYPWLSNHYPIFEKWTGAVELHPPVFKNSNARKTNPSTESHYGSCFLNKFRKSLSGKGIVLTIGDQHVDDTVHLITLLRALQNTLPIQIVYYDNLSGHSKSRIVRAAREEMRDLPESFEQVRDQFSNDYDRGLPKQEVYFVNTYSVIHDNYKSRFEHWGNKLLATVFNTFEEFLLIDADTILLKNPEWFFSNSKYSKSGAFFFRDRTTIPTRPDADARFIKKMSPSKLDAIMFDFPLITDHTLELESMHGLFHFMEAGAVTIDKTRHFTSILLLPQLNFMESFRLLSHGEKELFWLSFVVNGDEGFTFNKNFAAAAGKKSAPKVVNGRIRQAKEVCSAHPAHVDDETSELVWFNSGFHFCGKYADIDYTHDIEEQNGRYKEGLDSIDSLKAYYYEPLDIDTIIIPPFVDSQKMYVGNNEGEPPRGWEMIHELCNQYLWCAYNTIGGADKRQEGSLISVDEESQKLFRYYGDIWVGVE